MSNPTVSVVLTTYNQARWLAQAVGSVVTQTFPDWELLLIDNGSTDSTPEIVERYRADSRIRSIRHEQNQPHTVICNAGFRQAQGRYISLLYGDDYYLPRKLERQVAEIEQLPAEFGVVYASGYRLVQNGELRLFTCGQFRGHVLEPLLTQPQFFQPVAPLIRRECLLRYPYNEAIFMEGEGVFSKIAMRYQFHPIPEPLVVMREHENNMGKEIASNLGRNILLYEALFSHPDFPKELKPLKGQALGNVYRICGWEAIRREGRFRQGGAWLQQAVEHHPILSGDTRVRLGRLMAAVPTPVAQACNWALNLVAGAPAPPVTAPPTPVEGAPAKNGAQLVHGSPVSGGRS